VAYLAVILLGAVVPVVLAWLTKLTLDRLVSTGALADVAALAVGLAVLGLLSTAMPQVGQYLRGEIDRRVALQAQDDLFASVERFIGLGRFEDPAFLDRMRLAQGGIASPGTSIDSTFGVVRSVITLAGFLGSVLVISPVVTGLLIAAAALALPVELRLSRRRAAMLWRLGPAERRELFYAELLSRADAAKEVRLFGIGPFLRARMVAEKRASNDARRTMDRRELLIQGVLAALSTVVFGAGLVSTILAAARHELTVGDVSMYIAAVAGVQTALGSMITSVATAHQQLLMFGHYVGVVRAGPDLPLPATTKNVPELRRGIEFRDVWFRYSDDHPWVLRGVNLFIPHGQSVALVGHNGAGKSTIVKLICRFYDPTRGRIRWDGVDLRDLAAEDLRRCIGAVFQDYMCYDLTARDNIVVGDLSALEHSDRIQAAARRAGVHDTLASLPRGYETLLTRMFVGDPDDPQTGVVLSGGQWQRLALARAFLRGDRDLMILDEPSAGMDAETEHELHTKLRAIRRGRTSLLISHRLGTLRDADLIVVLTDGVISEHGRHQDLMDTGGTYARLFTLQASGYAADPSPGGPVPAMDGTPSGGHPAVAS
jgi:ATP-binding cassette subfamily B protein